MKTLVNRQFDFMGKRHIAFAISGLLILASIVSLLFQQLNLGLDFTGGTLVEVRYGVAPSLDAVRQALEAAGFRDVSVQTFGASTEVLIRLQQAFDPEVGNQVVSLLRAEGDAVELVRAEFVGAQVGEQLRDRGGMGLLVALGIVMLYVAFRFQYKFAIGALLALMHDVIIVVGVFSLFQLDFDLTVLAALLAVIGYSLNDTIVIFDRVREVVGGPHEGVAQRAEPEERVAHRDAPAGAGREEAPGVAPAGDLGVAGHDPVVGGVGHPVVTVGGEQLTGQDVGPHHGQPTAETTERVAVPGVADQGHAAPGEGAHLHPGDRVDVRVRGIRQAPDHACHLPTGAGVGLGEQAPPPGGARVPVVRALRGEHEEGGLPVAAGGHHAAGLVVHQSGTGGGAPAGAPGRGSRDRGVGQRHRRRRQQG